MKTDTVFPRRLHHRGKLRTHLYLPLCRLYGQNEGNVTQLGIKVRNISDRVVSSYGQFHNVNCEAVLGTPYCVMWHYSRIATVIHGGERQLVEIEMRKLKPRTYA
jgi:hypothetical protein